jgi:hypothetical protein
LLLPWAKFPTKVLSGQGLTPATRVVYGALVAEATGNPGRPVGAPTLARRYHLGLGTVQVALERLEAAGLITRTKHGSGSVTEVQLSTIEPCGCPPEFARTCPNSGRCLPATGQVACRLSSRFLELNRQVGGGTHDKREENKREEEVLSAATLQFGEEMKRKPGRGLSPKELAFLEPMFKAGVPVRFAVVEGQTWPRVESPWSFAARVQSKWGAVAAVLVNVDTAMATGDKCFLSEGDKALLAQWGSPEQRAYVFGPAERG